MSLLVNGPTQKDDIAPNHDYWGTIGRLRDLFNDHLDLKIWIEVDGKWYYIAADKASGKLVVYNKDGSVASSDLQDVDNLLGKAYGHGDKSGFWAIVKKELPGFIKGDTKAILIKTDKTTSLPPGYTGTDKNVSSGKYTAVAIKEAPKPEPEPEANPAKKTKTAPKSQKPAQAQKAQNHAPARHVSTALQAALALGLKDVDGNGRVDMRDLDRNNDGKVDEAALKSMGIDKDSQLFRVVDNDMNADAASGNGVWTLGELQRFYSVAKEFGRITGRSLSHVCVLYKTCEISNVNLGELAEAHGKVEQTIRESLDGKALTLDNLKTILQNAGYSEFIINSVIAHLNNVKGKLTSGMVASSIMYHVVASRFEEAVQKETWEVELPLKKSFPPDKELTARRIDKFLRGEDLDDEDDEGATILSREQLQEIERTTTSISRADAAKAERIYKSKKQQLKGDSRQKVFAALADKFIRAKKYDKAIKYWHKMNDATEKQRLLDRMIPDLIQTPEGRRQVAEMWHKVNDQPAKAQLLDKMIAQLIKTPDGRELAIEMWNKLKDPSTKAKLLHKIVFQLDPKKAIELCQKLNESEGRQLILGRGQGQEGIIDKEPDPLKQIELLKSLEGKKFADDKPLLGKNELLKLARLHMPEAGAINEDTPLSALEYLLKAAELGNNAFDKDIFAAIKSLLEKWPYDSVKTKGKKLQFIFNSHDQGSALLTNLRSLVEKWQTNINSSLRKPAGADASKFKKSMDHRKKMRGEIVTYDGLLRRIDKLTKDHAKAAGITHRPSKSRRRANPGASTAQRASTDHKPARKRKVKGIRNPWQ